MTEFEPRAPRGENLLERGGLTPAHWEEVLQRIGKNKGEVKIKVFAYAHGVISGEFPDTGFHHHKYLGQRHWNVIANLDVTDKVKTPRKFPPWSKTSFVGNELAQQIHAYASEQQETVYTVNDFVYERNSLKSFKAGVQPLNIDWSWGTWSASSGFPILDHTDDVEDTIITRDSDRIAKREVMKEWFFLNHEEAGGDVLHMSPKLLGQWFLALARQHPEEIQNRLRNTHFYTTIYLSKHDTPHNPYGILEEEIS